jgi:MFS family permease
VFFLLTGLLYVGLGMSFTGSMLYLLDGLKTPGTVVFGAVLLFRLASWPVSSTAGRLLGYFTPLRMQQFAGVWRFVAVMALSLVALLPDGPWSLVMVVLLLVLCGLSGGVMGVAGLATATEMAPRRYQSTLIFLFNAVSNGAVALGAYLSGVAAAAGGFSLSLALGGLCIGGALWVWRRY